MADIGEPVKRHQVIPVKYPVVTPDARPLAAPEHEPAAPVTAPEKEREPA